MLKLLPTRNLLKLKQYWKRLLA